MFGLLAETSIHPGTGRSMGVVDLPVAREAATDYPVLVGSSLKGALRDRAGGDTEHAKLIFGKHDHAGEVLVGDGRLLLLPVRSLTGAFRWVTCPHLIERYRRDRKRAGLTTDFSVPTITCEQGQPRRGIGHDGGKVFLEEREFTLGEKPKEELVTAVGELLHHTDARERLTERLVILHDDDFAWFARYGLAIQARNVLDRKTKQSNNLWYEETLPPETVFYALVAGRNPPALKSLTDLFPTNAPYLQAGGNETVGQGWFAVEVLGAVGGAQ
jgi:CRISPR-associated protein Cmr4